MTARRHGGNNSRADSRRPLMATSRGVGALATAAGLAIAGCGESGHEETASGLSDATDVSCTQTIERSTSLNGPQLFSAAEACARAEQSDDAVFLVLAGQVRAMADMSLLEPQSEPDEEAMAELYGAVYYKYGGLGPDELFRDADRASGMLGRLRSWRPSFPDGYNPGWNYKPRPDPDRYHLMVDYSKRSRLAQLETYRNLIQHDPYYAAKTERKEILARNDSRSLSARRMRIASRNSTGSKRLCGTLFRACRSRHFRRHFSPTTLPTRTPNSSSSMRVSTASRRVSVSVSASTSLTPERMRWTRG